MRIWLLIKTKGNLGNRTVGGPEVRFGRPWEVSCSLYWCRVCALTRRRQYAITTKHGTPIIRCNVRDVNVLLAWRWWWWWAWEQGWRSGESTRLPPAWPGFNFLVFLMMMMMMRMIIIIIIVSMPSGTQRISHFFPLSLVDNRFTASFNFSSPGLLSFPFRAFYTMLFLSLPSFLLPGGRTLVHFSIFTRLQHVWSIIFSSVVSLLTGESNWGRWGPDILPQGFI